MSSTPLVLASGSPRRRELLALLGAPFDTREPDVDESTSAEPARAKARASALPGRTVLAADTRIRYEGREVGKPRDEADARAMLARFSGHEHQVVTDVAVVDGAGREAHFSVASRVRMRAFDAAAAARYVATGEPLDAAGSYKVQGRGSALVESVEGCFANVVGLPLCHVYEALRAAGRATPERPERACQSWFSFTCPAWRHAQAQARAGLAGASFESWIDGVPTLVRTADVLAVG